MKILITGGTGLLGSRLIELLGNEHHINVLTRSPRPNQSNVHYYKWNPKDLSMDSESLVDIDAVINLAGAGIADKRWTNERKEVILSSRVDSAATLFKYINELNSKPKVYLGASAVGYYSDRADKKLIESDSAGTGFLADVTVAWEKAHQKVSEIIARSVILRIGIVLSTKGGALKEILKPTLLGAYGYFGSGNAYYPWIHIDDICGMIIAALDNENYSGIYNGSAPEPLTNKELVKSVKKAKKGIGLVMPVPVIALKIAMGEMTQMLTNSTRAIPHNMVNQGYKFLYSDATAAVKDLLEKRI